MLKPHSTQDPLQESMSVIAIFRQPSLCDECHSAVGYASERISRHPKAEGDMICKGCDSDNLGTFNGEVAIHYPGHENLDKPTVLVFPKLLVCLHCGLTEFTVPETETGVLRQGMASSTEA